MNLIVAVDSRWGIGKNNGLLFDIPADMKYFRQQTSGMTVVMGYNTLLSLPGGRPLKNRKNIVMCPDDIENTGFTQVRSLEELGQLLGDSHGDVYVIGGASVYNLLMPYVKYAYITKVKADGGAQVFIHSLDADERWKLRAQSEEISDAGYSMVFCLYENTDVQPLPKEYLS